jgi:hypothetical protein
MIAYENMACFVGRAQAEVTETINNNNKVVSRLILV